MHILGFQGSVPVSILLKIILLLATARIFKEFHNSLKAKNQF